MSPERPHDPEFLDAAAALMRDALRAPSPDDPSPSAALRAAVTAKLAALAAAQSSHATDTPPTTTTDTDSPLSDFPTHATHTSDIPPIVRAALDPNSSHTPEAPMPVTSHDSVSPSPARRSRRKWIGALLAGALAAGLFVAFGLPALNSNTEPVAQKVAPDDSYVSRTPPGPNDQREKLRSTVDRVQSLDALPADPRPPLAGLPQSNGEVATEHDFLSPSGDSSVAASSGNVGQGNAVDGRVRGRTESLHAGGGPTEPSKAASPGAGGGGHALSSPSPWSLGAENRLRADPGSHSYAAPHPIAPSSGDGKVNYPIMKPVYGVSNDSAPQAGPSPRGHVVADPNSAQWAELNKRRAKYSLEPGQAPDGGGKPLDLATITPRIIVQESEEELLPQKVPALNKLSDQPQTYEERIADGEQYQKLPENPFRAVKAEPLSTFSIDVDTGSYTNIRRFLTGNQLPPPAAVRVEEMLNYFRYDYPQPKGNDPFSVTLEATECPWRPEHRLLRVGIKGKEIDQRERPASNLVFLVDVSGSMTDQDKLPLLRDALHRWANELTENDRVSIVTYAGSTEVLLPSTGGDQKEKLHAAIERLQPGGSTHGSAGITLAYEQATLNFLKNGANRVLWATDGDLNVGITDDNQLVKLITDKAKSGVFLTVLGVGTGNLKDSKLEQMADHGNGIYAYLDSPKEARKVLIEQMSGTTITIAKDVKLQLEFNPAVISSYRLIGYENRMLENKDFADDKKDAGEIGAGHTVTALYELIPVGADTPAVIKEGETLKYQQAPKTEPTKDADKKDGVVANSVLTDAAKNGELLTVKLRFKQPDAAESVLREYPLQEAGGKFTTASRDLQFAACVAELGMILRDGSFRGQMTTAAIAEIAAANAGDDKNGERKEFVELVKRVQALGK